MVWLVLLGLGAGGPGPCCQEAVGMGLGPPLGGALLLFHFDETNCDVKGMGGWYWKSYISFTP